MTHLALLVGTSVCRDRVTFPQLPAVRNDVAGLQHVLQHPVGLFERVQILINAHSQRIRETIEEICNASGKNDLLLIYFSGHGKKDPVNRLYFAARNSILDKLHSTTFSLSTLSEILSGCLTQKVIIILDCCYSGAAAAALTKSADVEALRDITRGVGRYVLTSSGSFELSWVDGDLSAKAKSSRSLFTHHLIEGLRTGEADLNEDGLIDIEELYAYAKDRTNARREDHK